MFRRPRVLPLDADESSRFLPWTIAFMTYLAALALAGAIALGRVIDRFGSDLSSSITVQVPLPVGQGEAGAAEPAPGGGAPAASAPLPEAGSSPAAQAERRETALALLRATPGIVSAEALDASEVENLLAPWLGGAARAADLPLPDVIDVAIDPDMPLDLDDLEARLSAAVPGASVDDHGLWLERVTTLARSAELVAALVVGLTALAAAFTIVFVTRSSLAIHRDIIEVLHLIGAEDSYIARQFQAHALKLVLAGAVPGFLAAAVTLGLLGLAAQRVEALLLPQPHFGPRQWAALVAVPAAAGLIALWTARVTVMRRLARMP